MSQVPPAIFDPQSGGPSKKKKTNPLMIILGLSAGFFVLFLMLSGALFMLKRGSHEGGTSGSKPGLFSVRSDARVGVVEINGVILDSKKAVKQIREFEKDDSIKAIVVRLNSPGGSVGPSQEIYEACKRSKKPVVASMGSVAASGAYYIAMGAKKVFANPGTITGSIGVIMEFINLKELYAWAKVKRYSITTGKFKAVGADYKDMSPEEMALLQTMINDVLLQFRTAVVDGRAMAMPEVEKISDGRIFSGNQAKELKLIDETGTLHDAIQSAWDLAGLKGEPKAVYPYPKRMKLLDILLEQGSDEGDYEEDSSSRLGQSGLISQILSPLLDLPKSSGSPAFLPPGIYWLWDGH